MITSVNPNSPEGTSELLEQQIVRLQALLEASRHVHSTIDLGLVLQQAARVAVLELELEGAMFTEPRVTFGRVPDGDDPDVVRNSPRFPLIARNGSPFSELILFPSRGSDLSMYEMDFLEGLVLQTAVAAENAINHQRHLDYARVSQDLDAARTIQQSLLPQEMPFIQGYSLAARSHACYQVGGDYLDVVGQTDGSYLFVVADVAGKGLASALVCTAFRSAFRALARESFNLEELATRLSQQHWEEGPEARRRYVTAIFVRLDPGKGELQFVNAGHNPAILLRHGIPAHVLIDASGTPLGLLPGMRYKTEVMNFPPGSRLLLYTDGLTEFFAGEEEYGVDRLNESFQATSSRDAESSLDCVWNDINRFTGQTPQQDDMTAIALCSLSTRSEENASL